MLDEPSVVAVRAGTSQLLAAGHRAKEMLGRTPESVTAVRPLRDGVISDADVTERMIRWFVEQVSPSRLIRPRVVVCVPSDITSVERRALEDATLRSGARRVYVIEETMAAAIGAGLPVEETRASMVVDVGGGTTDVGDHQPRRRRHVTHRAHRRRRDRRRPRRPRQERVLPAAGGAQRGGPQDRRPARRSRCARS